MQPSFRHSREEPRERRAPGDPYDAYRHEPRADRTGRFTFDRAVRMLVGILLLGAVAWLVWYFGSLVVYLIVGVLLAYLMRPLVDRLQGVGLPQIPAILTAFVIVLGAITILLTELVPFAGQQIRDLSEQIAFEPAAQVVAVDPLGQTVQPALRSGDLIVAVDGAPWTGMDQLYAAIQAKAPGEVVELVVEGEDGTRRQVAVTVREPLDGAEAVTTTDANGTTVVRLDALGLVLREVTMSDAAAAIEERLRGVIPFEKGAIVRGVTTALEDLLHEERITRFAGSVVGIFTDIIYAVLVIPFVAFFTLKDGMRIRHGLLRYVPNRYFEITLTIVEKIETIIGRYFKALLVQCVSVATIASVLLYIIGLKYAVAVGVFTGLANTIPYFGPLMGFLAGTLVSIVQTGDFSLVPEVLVAMALTQAADNLFFQPFLFSRAAQTHPLIILFVVLMGAQVAGIVGMLVAIPLATILRVTVEQVLWSLRNYRILQNA